MFIDRADIFLLAMCIICSLYGITIVRRAVIGMTAGGALSNPTKYVVVQAFSMVLGIIFFVILTILDSDILGEQWKILCIINVLLLVALVRLLLLRRQSSQYS